MWWAPQTVPLGMMLVTMVLCRSRLPRPPPHFAPSPSQGPYRVRVLWLTAEHNLLNSRLDTRVDGMMARGLLREVQDLNDLLLSRGFHDGGGCSVDAPDLDGRVSPAGSLVSGDGDNAGGGGDGKAEDGDSGAERDPERTSPRDGDPAARAHGISGLDQRQPGAVGLLIAIGYKEFAAYFDACRAGTASVEEREVLLGECVSALKQVTRRYAGGACLSVSCRITALQRTCIDPLMRGQVLPTAGPLDS